MSQATTVKATAQAAEAWNVYTLCSKNVTTPSTITWTRIGRLQQFSAQLLPIIDRCFYFPISAISGTYFNLGNCQDTDISKKLNTIMKISQEDAILI